VNVSAVIKYLRRIVKSGEGLLQVPTHQLGERFISAYSALRTGCYLRATDAMPGTVVMDALTSCSMINILHREKNNAFSEDG
jgi:hypothetical protein